MNNIQLEHHHHSLSFKKYPFSFLAHDINIPMNIGSLFRIADALGVEKIYLSGSSSIPPDRKIRKTSRATEKYIPFIYEKDPLYVINILKSEGYTIVSLEVTSESIDIMELSVSTDEKICLILGSENKGIDQALLDVSDKIVSIPMLGYGSSMNVVVACAIVTFEITRKLS